MSSLDAQQRSEYGSAGPQAGGMRRPQQQAPHTPVRMTQKEAALVKEIQTTVQKWKWGGALAGGALATFVSLRRKPPLSWPVAIAAAAISGWVGGNLAAPIGVLSMGKDLQRIEDPAHFKQVLIEAASQKVRLKDMAETGSLQGYDEPQSTDGFSTSQVPGKATMGSGPARASYPNMSGDSNPADRGNSAGGPGEAATAGVSRWAQIRGDRKTPSSTWDSIRRQNAGAGAAGSSRNGYGASASASGDVGSSTSDPYPSLNTPQQRTWAAGSDGGYSGGTPYSASSASTSSPGEDEYARQQREFDAMLARERRSAEENQGVERLGTGFLGGSAANASARSPRW
ncbi:hypothetical protein OC846_004662 [Tilletia horrida]|uniref:Uncharacterized protein n=1 Tax=Tilletia horrida TaxID=155126 RepID=A0AAN6JWR3_9BASI|nr:hypothetical protein OC845_005680 [Tilletia horrida]KAK0547975.1 hypothetical protein OC846_004662 [Tilletia horrida]KAK0561736.1 hypothetical protein OC861_005679 [Tilletia horrida]